MKLRTTAIAALAAAVSFLPAAASAGDKGVVAPPFDGTFTQASPEADRCEADVAGHFVAAVSSTAGPMSGEFCQAGAYVEDIVVPQEGARLTVNWHVNDAFGADTGTDVNGPGCVGECVPDGANLCIVAFPTAEFGPEDGGTTFVDDCEPAGIVSNKDVTFSYELVEAGKYTIFPSVIAKIDQADSIIEARIDAVVTSISIEYPS